MISIDWGKENWQSWLDAGPRLLEQLPLIKDMLAHLEKLRTDAAECALIRDLSTDPKKRELFNRLAEHLSVLASEVEATITGEPDGEADRA